MALEQRLRAEALSSGMPLSRLRKMVAFDRLLARLVHGAPSTWVLKGGLALQVRFADSARSTKDVDLQTREASARAVELLVSCALLDMDDYFSFAIARPTSVSPGGMRCAVEARLDGREFERFHVDLGVDQETVGTSMVARVTSLLAFAGVPPVEIACLPLEQHVAEKVHALTRPRGSGEGSRVKDLADIVLVAETSRLEAAVLAEALAVTFAAAATHEMPRELPTPPRDWVTPYRVLAEELGLQAENLDTAAATAKRLVDPILGGQTRGHWSPDGTGWHA